MMTANYVTYFDLAASGYRAWTGPLIGLFMLLVGCVCIALRGKINELSIFAVSRARLYIFTGFAFIWTSYAAWSSYANYFSPVRAQRFGDAIVVQGKVRDFHPQTSEERGFGSERFCVQESCYEYSSFSSNNQFNQSHIKGGPIREGLQVRVTSYKGKIIKLEILR